MRRLRARPGLQHEDAGWAFCRRMLAASTMPRADAELHLCAAPGYGDHHRSACRPGPRPVHAGDAREDVARPRRRRASGASSCRASTGSQFSILATRRSTLAKSSMAYGRRATSSPPGISFGLGRGRRLEQRLRAADVDALHQVLVAADRMAGAQRPGCVRRSPAARTAGRPRRWRPAPGSTGFQVARSARGRPRTRWCRHPAGADQYLPGQAPRACWRRHPRSRGRPAPSPCGSPLRFCALARRARLSIRSRSAAGQQRLARRARRPPTGRRAPGQGSRPARGNVDELADQVRG